MANLAFSHGGNIYEVKRKFKKEVVDFSANINPLGLPLALRRLLSEGFDKIQHYPDPKARDITKAIAKYWGVSDENILLGNGSIELIYLIISAYRPKTTLIPVPTFSEYERVAKSVNSKIHFLKLKEKQGFSLNLGHFNPSSFDIFFICNPNNPTGNLILKNSSQIEKIADKLLVVDEAFMDFLPNQGDYTLIRKAAKKKRIAVLRTFTKFFSLPGLRIGYIVAHREVINKLRQYQAPWSINSLAQIAAEKILNNKEYISKTYTLIEKERSFLLRRLAKTKGLKVYPSVANFLLIKIEKAGVTSKFLKEALISKGILLRDCSNFRNLDNKYIRVAVRTRKENLKLLIALKKVI